METFINSKMADKMAALQGVAIAPHGGPMAHGHPEAGTGPKVWKHFTPKASTASNF